MAAANNDSGCNDCTKKCTGKNRDKLRSSTRIALSGILCSLSVLMMFMTGLLPFFQYALPMVSGMILVIIVVEDNFSTAMVAYFATSIIVSLLSPDREAAILYIMFFGHYGIIKSKIDLISSVVLRLIVKITTFNVCIIISFYIVSLIFGLDFVMESFGDFGKYSLLISLLVGNVIFIVYDFAISNMVFAYKTVIRPKYLGFLK